jgi:cell division initiation protein
LKITPLDIKKQEFKKSMRGFDPVEVEAFLEMIAEEYEAVIRERNHLSDEVLKLRTQLKDYQQVEKTFKESLMKAQQTIEQSRENSKHEAELIIREAELKADKILESTKIQLSEMKNELMLVKSQKDSFAKRLKHLLESQLELIGVLEIDDIGLGQFDEKPVAHLSRGGRAEKRSKSSEVEFSAIAEEEEDDESEFPESSGKRESEFPFLGDKGKTVPLRNSPQNEEPAEDEKNQMLSKHKRRRVKLSDQFII